jgi:hypothetical protein
MGRLDRLRWRACLTTEITLRKFFQEPPTFPSARVGGFAFGHFFQ